MLTLLSLKSRIKNSVELLSFTCDLVLQRGRQDLVVFVCKEIDLLFVAFLNLLYLFSLFRQ